MPRWLPTVLLLLLSNSFMTFAWYYHVKQRGWPLLLAIGLSWLIALPEYALQVPANRLGHVDYGGVFTLPQLKVLQEAITLTVFSVFTVLVARERLRVQDLIAFALVFLAVGVSMSGRGAGPAPDPAPEEGAP
ncbi:MAG: DMT family protein [Deltaproteobacteria bacterium]|nr:DMT family protein [Deltaproteobacteria bacterium]